MIEKGAVNQTRYPHPRPLPLTPPLTKGGKKKAATKKLDGVVMF